MTSAGKWSPCPWSQCRLKKKKKEKAELCQFVSSANRSPCACALGNAKQWKVHMKTPHWKETHQEPCSMLHSSAPFRDSHNVSKMQRVRAENIYQPAILSSVSIPCLAARHLMMIAKKHSAVNLHTLPLLTPISPCSGTACRFGAVQPLLLELILFLRDEIHIWHTPPSPIYKQWLYCSAVSQLISDCFFLDY